MSEQQRVPLRIVLPKPVGVISSLGGSLVLLLAASGILLGYPAGTGLFQAMSEPTTGQLALSGIFGSVLLGLAVMGLFGVGGLVIGARRLLRPEIQTVGPEPFKDYQGEISTAFTQGALVFTGSLSARLRLLFGKDITSLPPISHRIVSTRGNAVFWSALTIPSTVALILVTNHLSPGSLLNVPLILLLLGNIAQAVTDFLVAKALIPRTPPVASADYDSHFFQGFGHPTHLFSRLPISIAPLALPGFPNRIYKWGAREKAGIVADTGEFTATVFVEQQPQQLVSMGSRVGLWLLAVGWLWRALAVATLVGMLATLFANPQPSLWVAGLTLVVAVRFFDKGSGYLKQGTALSDSFRFRSIGVLIRFHGEVSRANVRVGGNSADTVGSENLATRSNFTAQFSAAELTSEASDFEQPRYLLGLQASEASREWIHRIREGIEALREKRVRPTGIDTASAEFSEITSANRQLLAQQAMLWATNAEAQVSQPEPTRQQTLQTRSDSLQPSISVSSKTSSYKDCPECAEPVRSAAKKCRFCGFRFERR